MSMGIKLIVNGKPAELARATTVAEYLAKLKIDGDYVAVALNSAVVKRADMGKIALQNGDKMEIVHPVGGG